LVIDVFCVPAIVSGLFSLSHLVWMTIAFDGYRRKSLWRVSSVCIANAASGILVSFQFNRRFFSLIGSQCFALFTDRDAIHSVWMRIAAHASRCSVDD
jgi:hypothetical protein